VVVARASHLLHTRGRRSGVVAARDSHLLVRGRRSGVTRGRNKPPIAVSGLASSECLLTMVDLMLKNSNMH
jgi:hypothetical protein